MPVAVVWEGTMGKLHVYLFKLHAKIGMSISFGMLSIQLRQGTPLWPGELTVLSLHRTLTRLISNDWPCYEKIMEILMVVIWATIKMHGKLLIIVFHYYCNYEPKDLWSELQCPFRGLCKSYLWILFINFSLNTDAHLYFPIFLAILENGTVRNEWFVL